MTQTELVLKGAGCGHVGVCICEGKGLLQHESAGSLCGLLFACVHSCSGVMQLWLPVCLVRSSTKRTADV